LTSIFFQFMINNFRSHIEVMKDHRLMSSNIKENMYVSEQVSYVKGRTAT